MVSDHKELLSSREDKSTAEYNKMCSESKINSILWKHLGGRLLTYYAQVREGFQEEEEIRIC